MTYFNYTLGVKMKLLYNIIMSQLKEKVCNLYLLVILGVRFLGDFLSPGMLNNKNYPTAIHLPHLRTDILSRLFVHLFCKFTQDQVISIR